MEEARNKIYDELIKDILEGSHPVTHNGGIKDMLNNLHSCFYSEDPRMCNILNNHFKHYWSNDNLLHYPLVNFSKWLDINVNNYIPIT